MSMTENADDLERSITTNACGKCRAARLGSCQCKMALDCAAAEEAEIENAELFVQQQALQRTEVLANKKEEHEPAAVRVETGVHNDFNTMEISDLLSANILSIDNDPEMGALTLRLLYNPGLLAGGARFEMQRYLNTLLRELEEFKKTCGISSNCIVYDKDSAGNILSFRINLPTHALYAAFIAQLASKSLLPTQSLTPQSRPGYQPGVNHFNPNRPLTARLQPASGRNRNREDEDEEKRSAWLPRLLPGNLV